MKKRFATLLCVCFALCLLFVVAGCAGKTGAPNTSPTPNPTAQLTSAQLLQAALEKIEFAESFEMKMSCVVTAYQVKGQQSIPVTIEDVVWDVVRTTPTFSTERDCITTLLLGDEVITDGKKQQDIYDYNGTFMMSTREGDAQVAMAQTASWFKPIHQATVAKKGTVEAMDWSTLFSDVQRKSTTEIGGVKYVILSAMLQCPQLAQLVDSDENRRYQQILLLSACNYLLADAAQTLSTVEFAFAIEEKTGDLFMFGPMMDGLEMQTAQWTLKQAGKQTKVTLAQLQNLKVYASVDFDKIDAVPAKDAE